MRVALIAVPYDSGHRGSRMGAGPEHLLQQGLAYRLAQAGHPVDVHVLEAPVGAWPAEVGLTFALTQRVARRVAEAVADGVFPLLLSGNCGPAALGCIAGLRHRPAVFWFDAHGDFNTPETTVSGFLDGMALASLTGRCWTQLATTIAGFQPVSEAAVTLVGARAFDPLEAAALSTSVVRQVWPDEFRTQLPTVLARLHEGTPAAYLHLDLDVLDPSQGYANSYAAPGGLSRADVEWAIASVAQTIPVRAAALTAFDPSSDGSGTACEAALALAVALANAVADPRRG